MKERLRAKVWFADLTNMVENFVRRCKGCVMTSHPDSPNPTRSWQVIAVDFKVGLPDHKSLFVAVDYFLNFAEYAVMEDTCTNETIRVLKQMFSRLGTPSNGLQFIHKRTWNQVQHRPSALQGIHKQMARAKEKMKVWANKSKSSTVKVAVGKEK